MTYQPPATETIADPSEALARVREIYDANTAYLRDAFRNFVAGANPPTRVRACYPFVRVRTETATQTDTRLSYGFVAGPGCYETTLTRPDLFGNYYAEQFRRLRNNHRVPLEIGVSQVPIPVHFAFPQDMTLDGDLDAERLHRLGDSFDLPDLAGMDDSIVNGTHQPRPGEPLPLALFTATRIDFSLHRLSHYTATAPDHFQNFVLFTNYQFYVDEFVQLGRELMRKSDQGVELGDPYIAFVEPGDVVTWNANLGDRPPEGIPPSRQPQMPAYHLQRADGSGITMVNIGVGPSNAKTITDHIAVLRPHAWIMLGHCAGLRNTQRLGDYVLAHGYVREDHVLDGDLPLWVPIPALAEVQIALERAVAQVTELEGYELKRIMRTGTVATVDNRNWELLDHRQPIQRFSQSRAIALDMESATIAANGFRFRVQYGTLLCVSDKPLHGEIKLPGMADRFYRERVDQHLNIGVRALELLREHGADRLHSRKLRSFAEVAFQ
jgi:AMP nucleosidase